MSQKCPPAPGSGILASGRAIFGRESFDRWPARGMNINHDKPVLMSQFRSVNPPPKTRRNRKRLSQPVYRSRCPAMQLAHWQMPFGLT